jgi:excisionase family DNA binding protein
MSESESQYVTVVEAARLAGVSRATVSRRIAAGEVAVFVGSDRRQRLLRRSEVERLAQVRALDRQATTQEVQR